MVVVLIIASNDQNSKSYSKLLTLSKKKTPKGVQKIAACHFVGIKSLENDRPPFNIVRFHSVQNGIDNGIVLDHAYYKESSTVAVTPVGI